jgi:transcriptional regulator with XRE-family HTH domain
MESTFASRVFEFRRFKGLSQKAFAERCDLEQGNITQMEKGTEPKQSNITKLIAGFPDLSADWLLLGNGPMLRNGQALTPSVMPSNMKPLPAGVGITLQDSIVSSSSNPDLVPVGSVFSAETREFAPPTPGLTSGRATVAEAENVLLRERLVDKDEQIADLKQQVARLWSLSGLMEKLGKMPSSLEAALAALFGNYREVSSSELAA